MTINSHFHPFLCELILVHCELHQALCRKYPHLLPNTNSSFLLSLTSWYPLVLSPWNPLSTPLLFSGFCTFAHFLLRNHLSSTLPIYNLTSNIHFGMVITTSVATRLFYHKFEYVLMDGSDLHPPPSFRVCFSNSLQMQHSKIVALIEFHLPLGLLITMNSSSLINH
jgi:hypothetical protein